MLTQRFWDKVTKGQSTDECWLWSAGKSGVGYAYYWRDGKNHRAHRLTYEEFIGPIPTGLVVDHLCRVKHCVNPWHLEAVTDRVNLLRGNTFQAENAAKTHCPQGHPYDETNTVIRNKSRVCRQCERDKALSRYYANYEVNKTAQRERARRRAAQKRAGRVSG